MRTLHPVIPKAFAPSASRMLFAIVFLCLSPQDVFAYVDPGSGLLLIQGLLAVIGGAIVFIKDPLGSCKRLWARAFSKSRPTDQ
jgi:hypothetical protein